MKKILGILLVFMAIGCKSGDVSLEDIQKNAKANAEASAKNPGTGANSY